MNSSVLWGVLGDRDHFRNTGVQVSPTIREFHLNRLDVLHNATHSEVALAMDLHRNKAWQRRGILAQLNSSKSEHPHHPLHPRPLHSHSQRRGLSFDVNADSLLECSDLRWRYRTSRPVTDAHTSAAPSQCLWKAQIEPFSQSLGRVLIVCEIQRRLCIICKTLCWYSKWALMAVEAQLGFITSFAVFDKQWKKLFLQENSTRGKKKNARKKKYGGISQLVSVVRGSAHLVMSK